MVSVPMASVRAVDADVESKNGQPVLSIPDAASWERWLQTHHADSTGAWLRLAKKASAFTSVTRGEALDLALCFGWIDAQAIGYDADYSLQRFCPRTKRSTWSVVNREKVAVLIADGRMRPAGQAAIDAARTDGRWDAAYEPPSRATVPPDLQAALDAEPAAAAFWATLDSRNRYAVLYRIMTVKRPETRVRNIDTFVAMLARGDKPHP